MELFTVDRSPGKPVTQSNSARLIKNIDFEEVKSHMILFLTLI